jgi:flagellar P-ring protein precursor FlgI
MKTIKNNKKINILLFLVGILCILSVESFAAKVKDIADVRGTGESQVIGYGIVVGLNQTGDNPLTTYTNQSILNMLKRFGLTIESNNVRMRNVAAVMVTATVPAFSGAGSKIDVVVSSMGDATSLQGGTLLLTPLATPRGQIVGNAQGPVTVGGYNYQSQGSQVSKNFVNSGRVPSGLILTADIGGNISQDQSIKINLRDPDFTTVTRVSNAINSLAGINGAASPIDGGTVQIALNGGESNAELMALISNIENLEVDVEPEARVIINERTGTVVIGGNVRILPAVISHGGLEISIQRQVVVPQPAPFTILPPRIAQTAEIEAEEELSNATPLDIEEGASVDDIANALNLLEVKPRDLIAIFQALKEAGALQAELIVQ